MSRIGRLPVPIPDGVDVTLQGNHAIVKAFDENLGEDPSEVRRDLEIHAFEQDLGVESVTDPGQLTRGHEGRVGGGHLGEQGVVEIEEQRGDRHRRPPRVFGAPAPRNRSCISPANPVDWLGVLTPLIEEL